MSEIAYSEEVNAEMLNNIAVDLGKTDFSVFENEVPYAVTKLNDITSNLVTAGILMSGSMCEPILNEQTLYIQPGIIVFNNGAKIRITQAVVVEPVNNTYIYALNEQTTNAAQIITSEDEPTTGDYVPICYIDADGVLTDKRIFSSAKVTIPTMNQYYEQEFELSFNSDVETESYVRATVDVGHPFKYVMSDSLDGYRYTDVLEDGVRSGWIKVPGSSYNRVSFLRNGTTINIYTRHTGSGAGSDTVKLYFV